MTIKQRIVYSLVLVFVTAGATVVLNEWRNRKAVEQLVTDSRVKDALAKALADAAKKKDTEAKDAYRESEKAKADAAKKDVAIASQKALIAKLQAERPQGQQPTPIETAQAELIVQLEAKNADLELQARLIEDAYFKETVAYTKAVEAYEAERQRANDLERALSRIPKPRRWHVGGAIGKDDTGGTCFSVEGSRSIGPVDLGVEVFKGREIAVLARVGWSF